MGDGSERNPYFRYINRNKKSLTLDYKAPGGREIFLKLLAGMDVLVENYRPTVMDRAGLGYEVLRQKNPRLVYAQLSGFGSDGPYRERGGLDLIAPGGGRPARRPPSACPSATSARACGASRASWPRSTSGSARARGRRSSARSSRRPAASRRGGGGAGGAG